MRFEEALKCMREGKKVLSTKTGTICRIQNLDNKEVLQCKYVDLWVDNIPLETREIMGNWEVVDD